MEQLSLLKYFKNHHNEYSGINPRNNQREPSLVVSLQVPHGEYNGYDPKQQRASDQQDNTIVRKKGFQVCWPADSGFVKFSVSEVKSEYDTVKEKNDEGMANDREAKEISVDIVSADYMENFFRISACINRFHVITTSLYCSGFLHLLQAGAFRINRSLCRHNPQ